MLPQLITSVSGKESRALARRLRTYECRNVTFVSPRFPIFWKKAKDQNVWDVDGNRFLDLSSGFGVSTAGFTPDWGAAAIRKQAQSLYHAMGDVHPTAQKAALCEALSKITFEKWGLGKGKTTLGNSGADAVEAALKTAFLATGKSGVIAFEDSYHGLNYGALTVTGRTEFRLPFRNQLKNFATFLPYPTETPSPSDRKSFWHGSKCLPALYELVLKKIKSAQAGAILVEPIQGRGGERIPPHGFLKMLRQAANETGALLISDEIYTGFYRTGSLFACEAEKVYPDIICLGKALSGGFPISACVGRAKWMDRWPESDGEAIHTSTFLGNPLGCSLALASLKNWNNKSIPKKISQAERDWQKALKPLEQLPTVGEVRGRGLLWGIELTDKKGKPLGSLAGSIVEKSLAHGLIILSGGRHRNVLSLSPSIGVTKSEIQYASDIMTKMLV